MATTPQDKMIAEGLFNDFTSRDEGLVKSASISVTDYLRMRVREDGVARRIVTPKNVTREDITRTQNDDLPVSIIDMQPNSSGAKQIPFGDIPDAAAIKANRFMVTYSRIASRMYTMDTARLMTYNIDLREMFYDLILKDLMDEEDRSFFEPIAGSAGNGGTGTIIGTKNSATGIGSCQWVDCGAFGRNSLVHLRKGLPSGKANLQPGVQLINSVSIYDFNAFDRTAAGGDLAQNLMFGDASIDSVNGVKTVVTTKRNLVPDNTIYQFAPENYLGVFYILEDVKMVTELKKDYLLEFGAHENIGLTIGNIAAIVRGDFNSGSASPWNPAA